MAEQLRGTSGPSISPYFTNENLDQLTYTLEDSEFLGSEVGLSLSPEFIDIDNDGDYDLFVGEYNGKINFYRNDGNSSTPDYSYVGYLSDIDLGFFSIPEFCDIDNDSDYDLFIGNYNGEIYFYENIGDSQSHNFIESALNVDVGSDLSRSAPRLIDLDSDNDFDLVVGTSTDGINIYWNIGDQNQSQFIQDDCLEVPYFGNNIKPSIVDINNDGLLDIIVGLSTGGFLHYKMTPFSDLNYDYNVDVLDIVLIINDILNLSGTQFLCLADTNHDGNLDILDILLIMGNIIND